MTSRQRRNQLPAALDALMATWTGHSGDRERGIEGAYASGDQSRSVGDRPSTTTWCSFTAASPSPICWATNSIKAVLGYLRLSPIYR